MYGKPTEQDKLELGESRTGAASNGCSRSHIFGIWTGDIFVQE
jgi:hypothetical protein